MMKPGALGFLLMLLVLLPGLAQAQRVYASVSVHLRAGPAPDYPVVAIVPAGVAISVQGCLGDYTWCDVVIGPDRGWMYAAYIMYPYYGRDVPVIYYGPRIGISVVGFVLPDYWRAHYRTRYFYRDRDRWEYRYRTRRVGPPSHGPREQHPPRPRQHGPGYQRTRPAGQGGQQPPRKPKKGGPGGPPLRQDEGLHPDSRGAAQRGQVTASTSRQRFHFRSACLTAELAGATRSRDHAAEQQSQTPARRR